MAFTYNGFGTKYYGEADRRPDGSFVTTEWITAAYIPLIPLRSFRFVRVQSNDVNVLVFHSQSYGVLETLPICWPQVGRVYAFVVGTALWWFAMGWLFFNKLAILDRPNAPYLMVLAIAVLALPFFVMWWSRREAYRARYAPPPNGEPGR